MKLLLLVGFVLSVLCSSASADDKKGPKVTDKVGNFDMTGIHCNRHVIDKEVAFL